MKPISIFLLFYFMIACQGRVKNEKTLSSEYHDSLAIWKSKRVAVVTEQWLPLAGLLWLEDGKNTFGSDSSNKLVFPNSAPSFMGFIEQSDSSLFMHINPDIEVFVNDSLIQDSTLRINDTWIFKNKDLEWKVIQRTGRYAVRIWDRAMDLEKRESDQLGYYPASSRWILDATYESYPEGKTYPIANVIGTLTDTPIPGKLLFEIDQKEYSLDVMNGDSSTFFVIFSDETNGEETYGAGRYMYVPRVKNGESTTLDFNKAYNPPCAFTEYATCPLPPSQNRIPEVIEAGEKDTFSFY